MALVAGLDPRRTPERVRSRIAHIAQDPNLYGGMSIGDHIWLAATLRSRFDRRFALARLRDLDLSPRQVIRTLSGGQRAQVGLAIALAARSDILLLDEPLAALDPYARREFLATLSQDIAQRGVTAVVSSHLLLDLESFSSMLVVLNRGRCVLAAAAAEARRQFAVGSDQERGPSVVGRFPDPDGVWRTLVHVAGEPNPSRRPATLEEIVLGHLAPTTNDASSAERT